MARIFMDLLRKSDSTNLEGWYTFEALYSAETRLASGCVLFYVGACLMLCLEFRSQSNCRDLLSFVATFS